MPGSEQARPAVSGEAGPVVLYHAMPPPPSPTSAGHMTAPVAPRRRGRPAGRRGGGSGGSSSSGSSSGGGSGGGGSGGGGTGRGRGRPPLRNIVDPESGVVLYVVRPRSIDARDLDAAFSANVRLSPKGPDPAHPGWKCGIGGIRDCAQGIICLSIVFSGRD